MLPPPEKPEAVWGRRYIILSFWAVILLLGIPTWWQTTSIPRAALPFVDMVRWENEQPVHIVKIRIEIPDVACETSRQLIADTQGLLDQRNEFDAFRIQLQLVHFDHGKDTQNPGAGDRRCGTPKAVVGSKDSALDVVLVEGSVFNLDLSRNTDPIMGTFANGEGQLQSHALSEKLRLIFADEQASVAYQYYTQGRPTQSIEAFVHRLEQETIRKIERDAARAFKPSPSYHLTFSLFTAGGTPSNWDIESALKHNIQPLTHSLSSLAKLSTTTQVQMYSAHSSSIQPFQNIDGEGWSLREQDLTAFINTAEWPLTPSVGLGPTINFILYVPAQNQLPLGIESGKGTSWIIPQWGGIAIVNPPLKTNPDTQALSVVPYLDAEQLQTAFEVFRTQLLALLGVPSDQALPLELRLRSFHRLAGLSLYLRTASNLASLARLSERLSNIPIPHHVLRLVEVAISCLLQFQQNRSLSHAKGAFKASETAFFDKSMVGQVYFPDEHKVAVYLPLLGPIGVPLVVALLREIKSWIANKKHG